MRPERFREYKPRDYIIRRPIKKLRPSPYENFAVNYSKIKLNDFFPLTKYLKYRGYQLKNQSFGPFNSTFFKLDLNYYTAQKARIYKYTVGLAVSTNFTAQIFWMSNNFRGAKKKSYTPLPPESPEAEKLSNFVIPFIEKKKFFTIPATFLNTTNISVFRVNSSARVKTNNYWIDMKYKFMNWTFFVSANLYAKVSRPDYFTFSYIGMKRNKKPKYIIVF